ncbi:MAG: transglutaminase family protein [Desulfobacterales bacterium]|jgi:transglutaminase-like putative cysteine protease
MKYRIVHKTAYRYSEPASLSQNELILHPRQTGHQQVLEAQLSVAPEPQYLHRRTDYFGNIAQVFMVQQPHDALVMIAESTVVTMPPAVPAPETTPPWEAVARGLSFPGAPADLDACQFVYESPVIGTSVGAGDYVRPSFAPGTPILTGALDLIGRIYKEFTYDKSATTVDTPVDQVLADRSGVCQDFAHTAIACLRTLGLAARYVSGYLNTLPPPGKPKLVGADESHAWISVYVPQAGWVDLDPTNNLIPEETHITLAWGRDYGDVTPVKGVVMGGGRHTLSVTVDVSKQEV